MIENVDYIIKSDEIMQVIQSKSKEFNKLKMSCVSKILNEIR